MSGVRASCCSERQRLDAGWQVALAPAGSKPGDVTELRWIDARVPGTAADAFRSAGLWDWDHPIDFDAHDWWWRTRIDGALAAPGTAVLGFDGLATLADVWLDGEHILREESMFVARQVTVRLAGSHEILIRCAALSRELEKKRPRPRWRVPMLKSPQLRWIRTTLLGRTPGWSPPCPPVGPWRDVWIARAPMTTVEPIVRSRLDGGVGTIDVELALGEDVTAASLVAERNGQSFTSALERNGAIWHGTLRIEEPTLWWPHTHGEPALYALKVMAVCAGESVAIDIGRTGFRDLCIVRDGGDFAVRVNGVDVFCRGACWTPLDVVSLQASGEDYRVALEQVRRAGMNMLRVAGTMTYEHDAFYDLLDECGILLWQDFMFANMDYPQDAAFETSVMAEVDQQIARFRAHPCLAVFCGNSEGEQQAAMSGAARETWSPRLFHETIAARVDASGYEYIPSSAHGGAFPHAANAGASSYYGVGAYLRPLEDARRSELRFASECLAFANIPDEDALPGGPAVRVHHAVWKSRSPRDLGAGWDFDDVRDHYVGRLYGIDPAALRVSDHDRYLALGRAATGEVMGYAFSEWRRRRSNTRGALVWFLRDLWPGAGWGVVDASGAPKPCYYALKRALAPICVAISDEGVNGLAVHARNDSSHALSATIELALYSRGDVEVCRGKLQVEIPAHDALEIAATDFLEGFYDLSFAYRFGPPMADVAHVVLQAEGTVLSDAFWFPAGLPSGREHDVGLAVSVLPPGTGPTREIEVSSRRFAQSVTIDAPGYEPDDNGFHLAPAQRRRVVLRPCATSRPSYAKPRVSALNAESAARFDVG